MAGASSWGSARCTNASGGQRRSTSIRTSSTPASSTETRLDTTPTWKANTERIAQSRCAGLPVNRDGARLMLDLRSEYGPDAHPITIAGITGPKGDAYKPEEAPPFAEAGAFHRSQIDELCDSGVDLLIAKTLPAFDEARAIAAGMADSGLPYVLSFVLRRDGTLLDGTPLETAIRRIDSEITRPPDCYFVNCVHASVFGAAMTALAARDPRVARRVRGLDANTSAKTPEELDGLEELDTESPEDFGRQV